MSLDAAIQLAVSALAVPDREIPPGELEVGVLVRGSGRRCFERLSDSEIASRLSS
jgi:hypothetical protein